MAAVPQLAQVSRQAAHVRLMEVVVNHLAVPVGMVLAGATGSSSRRAAGAVAAQPHQQQPLTTSLHKRMSSSSSSSRMIMMMPRTPPMALVARAQLSRARMHMLWHGVLGTSAPQSAWQPGATA
jgi:hypothetical protein